jgi:hypothetical protein
MVLESALLPSTTKTKSISYLGMFKSLLYLITMHLNKTILRKLKWED